MSTIDGGREPTKTVQEKRFFWQLKCRELSRERGNLARRIFEGPRLTRAEARLFRHIDRELDFYQMKLMEPAFERMEAQIRANRRLSKKIDRLIARGRKLGALP